MCKGNCKECKRLQIPCRTLNDRETVFCYECDKYGMMGQYLRDVYPAVQEEIADARNTLKRSGKDWAIYLHGKIITAEAERQEAKMA